MKKRIRCFCFLYVIITIMDATKDAERSASRRSGQHLVNQEAGLNSGHEKTCNVRFFLLRRGVGVSRSAFYVFFAFSWFLVSLGTFRTEK